MYPRPYIATQVLGAKSMSFIIYNSNKKEGERKNSQLNMTKTWSIAQTKISFLGILFVKKLWKMPFEAKVANFCLSKVKKPFK